MIIDTLTTGNWIAIISIVTIVILAFLGLLGTIIYRQGSLDKGVANLDRKFDKLDEKFDKFIIQPLANNKSPLKLTESGLNIFNRPKIQQFVKANLEEITLKMRSNTYDSAYQAQEKLFAIVNSYQTEKYKINLENEAFETGLHIDILMKIIAIGIRDEIFAKLNVKIEYINNGDSSKT